MITEMIGTWAIWGVYSIVGPKLISEKAAEKSDFLKAAKGINDFAAAVCGLCFISPILSVEELYKKAYKKLGS